jgi:predicted RNA-binding Zn-ribbon protein involved in translation (DUF1610 family)
MSLRKQTARRLRRKAAEKEEEAAQIALRAGLRQGTIVAVDRTKVISRSALPQIPDYYRDTPFTCQDCGTQEVWTAKQQQWWYEVQGGEIESKAVRCRACRQQEKQRRNEARRVHQEGLQKKVREKG